MKVFILLASMTFTFNQISAQIKIPSASPLITMAQKVGVTEIELSYSRPGVKSRDIFSADGLVPFNEFWRTGANSPTTLTIDEAIEFNGHKLEKGSYVMITKPGLSDWDIYLYRKDKGGWNSYIDKTAVLTITVKSQRAASHMESLLIYIDNIKTNSANLRIHWANTLIEIPIGVEVHDKVIASINKSMAGPSDFEYFQAASYLASNGTDQQQALEYIQMVTKGENPRFFHYRIEAVILAKLGQYDKAIKSAIKSNELAEKAGNIDAVKLNNSSIEEWMAK